MAWGIGNFTGWVPLPVLFLLKLVLLLPFCQLPGKCGFKTLLKGTHGIPLLFDIILLATDSDVYHQLYLSQEGALLPTCAMVLGAE
jgi:hypothetical protein